MRKLLKDSTERIDRAAGILFHNRQLKAIGAILGADAACLILTEGPLARVIAHHGIPYDFLAAEQTTASAPYKIDELVIVRDASARSDLHAFLGSFLGVLSPICAGFFYRCPLIIGQGRIVSLLAFGQAPRPDLGERELAIALEIGNSLLHDMERYYPASMNGVAKSMALTMADVERWLAETDLPTLVFDSRMILRAVNDRMLSLLKVHRSYLIGRTLGDMSFIGRGGLEFLFRHALDSGVSTPRVDLSFEEALAPDIALSFRLVGSPLSLIDGEQVLVATIDPSQLYEAPLRSLPPERRPEQLAMTEFLLETLVERLALRTRKLVSYVTLRSWRQSIREHQITALRAIKKDDPRGLAAEIAVELRAKITSLFGIASFQAVVPMPCGHSKAGNCLSEEIAKALARDIGVPVAHALSIPPDKGSSHPLRNVSRERMTLTTPVKGLVLLIDDVTTSGRHIEEATLLLREGGASVLAVAWIGGDASEEPSPEAKPSRKKNGAA